MKKEKKEYTNAEIKKIHKDIGILHASMKSMEHINIVRTRESSIAANSIKQLKFKIATDLILCMSPMFDVGYTKCKKNEMPTIAATNHIVKKAIYGEYPDFAIDYGKLVVSNGNLARIWLPEIVSLSADVLEISWADDSYGIDPGNPSDLINVVFYCDWKNSCHYFERICSRGNLRTELKLPCDFAGEVLQCWIFAVNEKGNKSSHSVFLGELLASLL